MTALRTVVITDTSPLLTLALAGALDTLLLLDLPGTGRPWAATPG